MFLTAFPHRFISSGLLSRFSSCHRSPQLCSPFYLTLTLTHMWSGVGVSFLFILPTMERSPPSLQGLDILQLFSLIFVFLKCTFNVFLPTFLSVDYVHAQWPQRLGALIPWNWSYSCELSCGCWESNLGLLEEQQVLLTAKPFLQSLPTKILRNYFDYFSLCARVCVCVQVPTEVRGTRSSGANPTGRQLWAAWL